MKTQGGKSLIITVILIGIDLSSSWELFVSTGNTYFHRIEMTSIQKVNEAKIKHFL